MELSWLERLAPELVIIVIIGLILLELSRRMAPIIKAATDGVNATVQSYEAVSRQQSALFDRLDRLNQREIGNLQKELDAEKVARADLERRLLIAQQDLGALRVELEATKRELLEEKAKSIEISSERDILAARVKELETQVADLKDRLDKANHVKEKAAKRTIGA